MKEAIGGSWITIIVITFIVLFASFMSLSINWSKTYKVKDEIVLAIERNNGVNPDSLEQIGAYMADLGYRTVGDGCPDHYVGFTYDGTKTYSSPSYCIKANFVGATATGHKSFTAYYSIVVFFRLDVPIIRHIIKLDLEANTKIILPRVDDLVAKRGKEY